MSKLVIRDSLLTVVTVGSMGVVYDKKLDLECKGGLGSELGGDEMFASR